MDHIVVDIDSEVEYSYTGVAGTSTGLPSVPVPIEAKLRTISVQLLYEVCGMQNFSLQDLRMLSSTFFWVIISDPTKGVFDDDFIDQLFDLVEQTRNMQDDTFNYSVIKLIVCFLVELVPSLLLRTWSDFTERTIYGRFSPFWLPTLW